jgi:hypothetical protein
MIRGTAKDNGWIAALIDHDLMMVWLRGQDLNL